jgi:hypothetical protein
MINIKENWVIEGVKYDSQRVTERFSTI